MQSNLDGKNEWIFRKQTNRTETKKIIINSSAWLEKTVDGWCATFQMSLLPGVEWLID